MTTSTERLSVRVPEAAMIQLLQIRIRLRSERKIRASYSDIVRAGIDALTRMDTADVAKIVLSLPL